MIHTGRPGVIAFTNAYHGLTYGALDTTARKDFREPFEKQLPHFTRHCPFGKIPKVREYITRRMTAAREVAAAER